MKTTTKAFKKVLNIALVMCALVLYLDISISQVSWETFSCSAMDCAFLLASI